MSASITLVLRRRVQALIEKVSFPRFMTQSAWFAPAFVLLLTILIYRRLIAGWVVATGDLQTYFFPYWVEVSRSLRSGELPLWNPYLFSGVPLLANSQAGVFYPLNWPFWFLAGDTLKDVASALHASVVLHVCLALLSMYYLGRKMRLGRWAAALAGFIFAGSGFIGVHIEHLNQLQALAWMPFVLLPTSNQTNKLFLPRPLSLAAMMMILLAGHTQMAFIAGVTLLLWCIFNAIVPHLAQEKLVDSKTGTKKWLRCHLLTLLKRWVIFFIPYIISGMIAAVQLLPTLELANFSGRQGGLDWREAVSFSLQPWTVAGTFLPPYLSAPVFPESVAYVGGFGLCLVGGGIWSIFRKKQSDYSPIVLLAVSGITLALGGYNPLYLLGVRLGLPGLIHFRAPVRFLALYSLSAALLAGIGYEYLRKQVLSIIVPNKKQYFMLIDIIVLVIICGELLICAEWLPHADATVPRAYTDLRPATSHLVSVTNMERQAGNIPGRFLSISQMLFEVGDKQEIESIYSPIISADALWSYLVSEKQREILAPNLPLVFRTPAVDGYDGGLLPLASYITFSHLLVENGTQDGRLRENLVTIPDRRWLKLMDVRYIITDKVSDTWIDDILYDRQFTAVLSRGETLTLAWLPDAYKADGIGLLYTGQGGQIVVKFGDGNTVYYHLPVVTQNTPYRLRWENSATVDSITLSASTQDITFNGISLINEVTDSFYPLTLSDTYKLSHSGDVKIYEDIMFSDHVFFVPVCHIAKTDSQALSKMAELTFDPFSNVILDAADTAFCPVDDESVSSESTVENSSVRVLEYEPTEITLEVQTQESGFIIISDAWYPGWRVQLINSDIVNDTQTVPVLRGNLMFRAIPVPAGHWFLDMKYQSQFFLAGMICTGIGVILLFIYCYYFRVSERNVGI